MTSMPEFDNYLTHCRICGDEMFSMAFFDIFTHEQLSNKQFDFQAPGSIVYFYNGKRFIDKLSLEHASHPGVVTKIADNLIKSFKINRRIYPNLGRHKISSHQIDAIPMILTKDCIHNKTHRFGYRTDIIDEYNQYNHSLLRIDREFLEVFGHQIITKIENNEPQYTEVLYWDNAVNSDIRLPPVPFQDWDISSKENLTNQIRKFSMLL